MKNSTTQVELSKREEARLDDLAKTSTFWASVRCRYAEWGALTQKQNSLFIRDCSRAEWMDGAQKIVGVPVRNKFHVVGGKQPRCANRGEQCPEIATVVIGTFGYCAAHSDAATEDLNAWKADREKAERPDGAPAVAEDDAEAEEEETTE